LLDINPYDQSVLLELQLANKDDVDHAYAEASAAQKKWAQSLPAERAQLLHRVAAILTTREAEIVDWLIRESGSTRLKAMIEVGSAKAIVEEAASFPSRVEGQILAANSPHQESRVYREPLGVIAVISPWTFPFHLSMRSVAPAIALGNAVVLKPASDTPVTGGLLLAKIFEEAGAPAGIFNVLVGAGSEIGDYFVEHPMPALISFTGSTEVGLGVGQKACGKYLKHVALELGGNAPLVVLDDADVEQAVKAAVFGRFLHQGQICMSTNRVIVDASIHDRFVEALVAQVKTLKVGDPDDMATAIGPIINAQQLGVIQAKIAQAKHDGAKLILGGDAQGNLLPPHLFSEVNPNWSIARDETFGPVLPVIRCKDEAEALMLANASLYGLSSAVFTQNLERGVRFARGIRAGMTHINDMTVADQPNAPFGGEKNSGLGRFNGQWVLEEFTRTHWITLRQKSQQYPF
jgi:aldehyde dehydrogenase (NAD+)